MANTVRKRSNWVGVKRTDYEQYVRDLDRDVENLFEEKSINIRYTKRYAYTIGSSYSG